MEEVRYLKNFEKYKRLTQKEYDSFHQFAEEAIKQIKAVYQKEEKMEAILVSGFSGNGKTTWINEFLRKRPDYKLVSMDEATRKIIKKYNATRLDERIYQEILQEFGTQLEVHANLGESIILDGLFINLLTRLALIDTLHDLNYPITLVDLTPNIHKTLKSRIEDEVKKVIEYGKKQGYSREKLEELVEKQIQFVQEFYQRERQRNNFDEQITLGLIDLGIDKKEEERKNTTHKK